LRSDVDAHTKHHREHASHEHRVRALCTLRAGSAFARALEHKYTPVQVRARAQVNIRLYRIYSLVKSTVSLSIRHTMTLYSCMSNDLSRTWCVLRSVSRVDSSGAPKGSRCVCTRLFGYVQAYLYVCKAVTDCPLIVSCIVVEPIRLAQLVPPVATTDDVVIQESKSLNVCYAHAWERKLYCRVLLMCVPNWA
jgi:hypothetical protein